MSRKRGVTLVEFIVVLGLFSVLTLTLYAILSGGIRAYRKAEIITILRKNGNNLMDWLSTDLRLGTVDRDLSDTTNHKLVIVRYPFTSESQIANNPAGHLITYQYNATDCTVTREDYNRDDSTTTTYTFGGRDRAYIDIESGDRMFTLGTSGDIDQNCVYVKFLVRFNDNGQSVSWLRGNEPWKLVAINTRIGNLLVPEDAKTAEEYKSYLKLPNAAIDNPEHPSNRIRFRF